MKNFSTVKSISLLVILFAVRFMSAQTASLPATLSLYNENGISIPFQNGMPVPTFERQDRQIINLDGTWKKLRFSANHDITLAARDSAGYANLVAESQNYFLPSFNDSSWQAKDIPSVENTMNPSPSAPEYYQDGVWYRRTFFVPDSLQGKFFKLMFYSVNYVADVWINGHYIGYHEGGYTSFAFDVSKYLNFNSENLIAVRVDNPGWGTRNDIVPYYNCDWFNYEGIIHDVYIEVSSPLSVIRTDIVPLDTAGNIQTTVVVLNKSGVSTSANIHIDIYRANIDSTNIQSETASALAGTSALATGNLDNSLTVASDSLDVWRTILKVDNPMLWSPKFPNLYIMKVTVSDSGKVVDQYYTQFGIRTIVTQGTKVLLNGKPVFFTGVARHEDHPIYGRAIPDSVIYTDLKVIKGLNANMIRTAHYPNAPFTYTLADRMGFAIMEEIPVWWFDDPAAWAIQNNTRHIHQQMFREMVFRDYNRPSIIFWSTCNECLDVPDRAAYIQTIQSDIKNNYNDGRLITQSAAANRPGPQDVSQDNCDVAGWTMYFGIFYGSNYNSDTQSFLDTANIDHPNKPIMDTEFGYWSTQSGSTELQQAQVFLLTFKVFQQNAAVNANGTYNPNGYVVGSMWWCAFDWYTAQTGLQTMGIYHMDRTTIKKVGPILQSTYKPYYQYGGTITAVKDKASNVLEPMDYRLNQNYPNPFNPSTTISFSLKKSSNVTLKIYDILGNEVLTVINNKLYSQGAHEISANMNRFSSGVYFYQLVSDNFTSVRKMILLK